MVLEWFGSSVVVVSDISMSVDSFGISVVVLPASIVDLVPAVVYRRYGYFHCNFIFAIFAVG